MADLFDTEGRGHDSKPTSALIRDELGLVLRSGVFRAAGRSSQLLTYLVDQALVGKSDELKEYVIGLEVFGKHGDYDPHSDSIVRVQVGRLRARLATYYATEGRTDPVAIDLAPGSYKPAFRMNLPPAGEPISYSKRLSMIGSLDKRVSGLVLLVLLLGCGTGLLLSYLPNSASWFSPSKTRDLHGSSQHASDGSVYFAPYFGPSDAKTRISAYEAVVLRYPTSPQAWAALANAYCVYAYLTDAGMDLSRKATDAARRALELAPDLAEGHAELAWIDFYYGWSWDEAEAQFRQALSLKPDCGICHDWHALFLAALGRSGDAITEAGDVARINPSSYFAAVNLASVLYYGGRFSEAEREARFAVSLDTASGHARGLLIASLVAANKSNEVLAIMPPPGPEEPSQDVQARFVSAYAQNGNQKAARSLLKILEGQTIRGEAYFGNLAMAYAGLGDRNRVVSSLSSAVQKREPDLVFLAVEPAFAAFHSDGDFKDILADVRAHRKSGPARIGSEIVPSPFRARWKLLF